MHCSFVLHCAHELIFHENAHKDIIKMFFVGLIDYEKSRGSFEALFTNIPWSPSEV